MTMDCEQEQEQEKTSSTDPPMSALSQISLHSPSQIVGTPFTIDAPPFEYPFPDTSDSSTPSTSPSQHFLSTTPPTTSSFSTAFSPTAPDIPTYSPTHPKMRAASPPVPPGLAKKRQRWSLGILSRRRSSSYGSDKSNGSNASSTSRAAAPPLLSLRDLTPPITGPQHTPPLNEEATAQSQG
ncbi:hypothetical protein BD779DRAFT_1496395 [Infundibulicybe gibba]|nr:hypothetical protein BD779DRAFT_1496395 [Infundibulicybe gibba]